MSPHGGAVLPGGTHFGCFPPTADVDLESILIRSGSTSVHPAGGSSFATGEGFGFVCWEKERRAEQKQAFALIRKHL